MITVLVPTHRGPAELRALAELFAAQTHADRRLVVIENGPAIGTCARYGIHADAVLSSEHSKSAALNVGLEWLRAKGGGAWALWDDDDYYGPGYLEEVAQQLPGHELVGKSSLYVRRNDGQLWLVRRSRAWPLGHSFAGWSDCCNFRPCNRWGEDDQWIRDMLAAGARLGRMGETGFVWQRTGDLNSHIWPATDSQCAQLLTLDREHSEIVDLGFADTQAVNMPGADAGAPRVILPKFDPLDVPGIPESFRALFRKSAA